MIQLFAIESAFIAILLFLPQAHAQPRFDKRVDLGLIEYDAITEASGLAASRMNPEVLWLHNDSGDLNRLYAINTAGKHLGVYTLAGCSARDWEDLAIGPGPEKGTEYLYVGDIGDNDGKYGVKYVYRVPEPHVQVDQKPVNVTLQGAETIALCYPDGNHDAETLLLDPLTLDLYLITKDKNASRIYCAPYPQARDKVITMKHVMNLPFGWVTAGDISRVGDEILIKTYAAIYFWPRPAKQSVAQALSQKAIVLPYVPEPQGEALAWKADGKGYYTVSEESRGVPARLYFYPRILSSHGTGDASK